MLLLDTGVIGFVVELLSFGAAMGGAGDCTRSTANFRAGLCAFLAVDNMANQRGLRRTYPSTPTKNARAFS